MAGTEVDAGEGSRWIEHGAGYVAASVAALGAVLYFFGSLIRDNIAGEIGLAAAPGPYSVQQTMVVGARALLTGEVATGLAISVGILFVAGMITVSVMMWRNKERFENLPPKKKQSRLANFFSAFVCCLIFSYMMIMAAESEGLKAYSSMVDDLLHKCSNCYVYKTKDREAWGIPVFQTDSQVYVTTFLGLAVIRTDDLIAVDWPTDKERLIRQSFLHPTKPPQT